MPVELCKGAAVLVPKLLLWQGLRTSIKHPVLLGMRPSEGQTNESSHWVCAVTGAGFPSEISSISLGLKKDGFCMKTLMEHIFKVVQARQTPAFPFKYHNILNPWKPPVSSMCVCSVQHNYRWLPIDNEIKTQRPQYVIWRAAHRAGSCSRVPRWHASTGWSCNTSWQLTK